MSDLDDTVRAMLATRAQDISTVPDGLLDAAGGRTRSAAGRKQSLWHAPTRLLVAAAVAAILVIAGAAVGLRQLVAGGSDAPAAPIPSLQTGTSSGVAPSPTTSPPASTDAASVPAACPATLPAAWRTALDANGSTYGAQSAVPEAVTTDGGLLVARDFGHGGARDLALIEPDKNPHQVFAVTGPDHIGIQNAYLNGSLLVVSVGSNPRAAKGTVPGSSPMPNVTHIYLVDLRTGERNQIAAASKHSFIDSAALLDGTIYWDELPHYGAQTGTVESYDLATGTVRTAYSGPGAAFYAGGGVSAAGIYNGSRPLVSAALPAAVATAVTASYRANVQTDGTSYAWIAGPSEIGWWTPGRHAPTYLHLPSPLPHSEYPDLLLVAGHYVMIGALRLVDMSTGAVAAFPRAASTTSFTSAGSGVFLGERRVGTGHWQHGYWVDPQPHVVRVSTASLPDLHC